LVRLKRKDRAGQQHRLHAGGAELAQRFFGHGFQMVGCGRAQFRGQRRAGAGAKLLGVNAQPRPCCARR
jgi:hypothetical protein